MVSKKDVDKAALIVSGGLEGLGRAYRFLLFGFSNPVKHTYRGGKTLFRNFLCKKMGCSMLQAEELVDVLEEYERLEFRKLRPGDIDGIWEVH